MLARRARATYAVLLALRLLVALSSHSIIHPDEHFQNPETAAGLVFDYGQSGGDGLLRTWEWDAEMPCRSVGPVWISMGAAFGVVRLFTGQSDTDPRQMEDVGG